MDLNECRQLAEAVSSPDLMTSREAKRKLSQWLSPSNIQAMLSSPEQAAVLTGLLSEVRDISNEDIHGVVGNALFHTFSDSSIGARSLAADESNAMTRFLLSAFSSNDLGLASRVHPAVLALLRLVDGSDKALSLGSLLNDTLQNNKVLRLFNCDDVGCEDNSMVYHFVSKYTTLVSYITSAATASFQDDPLSLANYLVLCGIIGRKQTLPAELLTKVQDTLEYQSDELYVAFTCRFCAIMLRHSESNAVLFADAWLRDALSHVEGYQEDTVDAIFDLVGAASSTEVGWKSIEQHLQTCTIAKCLRSTSMALRLSTLRLLTTMLSSPYSVASYFNTELLHVVWQLKKVADDDVRLACWQTVLRTVEETSLRTVMTALYASYLSGPIHEHMAAVCELQVQVASVLINSAELPEGTVEALAALQRRGIYPPGSTGVAEMRKD